MKADELLALNSTHVVKGATVTVESSSFTGYVCDAENFDDVNRAFEWVRFHNMDTRHIVVACRLPRANKALSEDYYDFDEHGAGYKLLEYMETAKIQSRAIFVTRHYDGKHIGYARFEAIIDAAKSAINHKPFNRVSQQFQFLLVEKRHTAERR